MSGSKDLQLYCFLQCNSHFEQFVSRFLWTQVKQSILLSTLFFVLCFHNEFMKDTCNFKASAMCSISWVLLCRFSLHQINKHVNEEYIQPYILDRTFSMSSLLRIFPAADLGTVFMNVTRRSLLKDAT